MSTATLTCSTCGKSITIPLPTLEERVPRTLPGDPKIVSNPRYMLVYHVYTRAKPPVNCMPPNRKVQSVEEGSCWFPKRKRIARGELAMLRSKIEH